MQHESAEMSRTVGLHTKRLAVSLEQKWFRLMVMSRMSDGSLFKAVGPAAPELRFAVYGTSFEPATFRHSSLSTDAADTQVLPIYELKDCCTICFGRKI